MCSMRERWEGASEGCLIYPCSCLVKLKVDILAIGISASTSSIEHDPPTSDSCPRNRQSHFLDKYFATSKGRQRDTPTTVDDRQQQQQQEEEKRKEGKQQEEQQQLWEGGSKTGT